MHDRRVMGRGGAEKRYQWTNKINQSPQVPTTGSRICQVKLNLSLKFTHTNSKNGESERERLNVEDKRLYN